MGRNFNRGGKSRREVSGEKRKHLLRKLEEKEERVEMYAARQKALQARWKQSQENKSVSVIPTPAPKLSFWRKLLRWFRW